MGRWVLAFTLAVGACSGESPTEPTPGTTKPPPGPRLGPPVCAPVQTAVHCMVVWAEGLGRTDVTQFANWSVSSARFSQTDTDVATVASPGVIVPLERGNIYIRTS